MKKIQCTLRDNAIWSDGSKITNDDVIASIATFKEKSNTPALKSALASTTVKTGENNTLVIESPNATSSIITALSAPILRSDVIDQLKNNRLKTESYITSGPFIFQEALDDAEYGYHSIVLAKNPNYKGTVWLDKIRFRIFPDMATLNRGISMVELIIPPLSQENIEVPKSFKKIEYHNYEFYGNFLNTDTIDPNLRSILMVDFAKKIKAETPTVA